MKRLLVFAAIATTALVLALTAEIVRVSQSLEGKNAAIRGTIVHFSATAANQFLMFEALALKIAARYPIAYPRASLYRDPAAGMFRHQRDTLKRHLRDLRAGEMARALPEVDGYDTVVERFGAFIAAVDNHIGGSGRADDPKYAAQHLLPEFQEFDDLDEQFQSYIPKASNLVTTQNWS